MNRSTVVVVAHDAGGAEILSSYLKKNPRKGKFAAYISGAAQGVFKRKNVSFRAISASADMREILKQHAPVSYVLCDVGWTTPLGIRSIASARSLGIRSVCYLDHWVNYRERFGYPRAAWKSHLPDEIWAGDRYALSRAKKLYPQTVRIRFVPNPYYAELVQQYARSTRAKKTKNAILFLSEPISEAANSFGDESPLHCTEYDVLRDVLVGMASASQDMQLHIRLHPTEKKTKYDALLAKAKSRRQVVVSSNADIIDDLAVARAVIGMDSAALMISALCSKPTISYIPDRTYQCTIPHPKVLKVKSKSSLAKKLAHFVKY